ncbi:ABC transporter permease [Plantibacter sp. YIM 135249]|uniref:ABC transporter permease n=1 Tax=Plantibacter sp. YIM 135249 TaxID=3423918 RepID=UPI003D33A5C9
MRVVLWSVRRILVAALTVLGVSILIFGSVRLLPGDYADLVLGPLASPAQRAEAVAKFGLDDNVVVQYLRWLGDAVRGDFGVSFVSNVSVTDEFAARMPVTATIALLAIIVTLVVGIPLGAYSALRSKDRAAGTAGRIVSALGISIPEFVLGGVVVFVVSSAAVGLRIGGFASLDADPAAYFGSLLLPTVVLSVACVAVTARNTRDAVMNVLVEPHIAAAVARGESPWQIVRYHVARNAAAPVLTVVATIVATLLGGTVIVESIFNIPGMGSYLVTALGRRDYAIIQASVLLAAVVFIVTSLLIDLLSNLLDPRLAAKGASS